MKAIFSTFIHVHSWSMTLIVPQFFRMILKVSPQRAVGSGAAGI
jgi:hypothetical protein